MNQNLKSLLLSELYAAHSYLDRILHGAIEVAGVDHDLKIREMIKDFVYTGRQQLIDEVLRDFYCDSFITPLGPKAAREAIAEQKEFMKAFITLGFANGPVAETTVRYINLIYQHAYDLHRRVNHLAEMDIPLPRLNLVHEVDTPMDDPFEEFVFEKREVNPEHRQITRRGLTLHQGGLRDEELNDQEEETPEELKEPVRLFQLNLSDVLGASLNELGSVTSLESRRDHNYDRALNEGHDHIFHKNYQEALDAFFRASNFRETAEILTLIGWTYSLMENMELAKKYCMQAIRKDPDYGPPYNDLGTYLLNEGKVNESLRWFDLAKKSVNYQNREYPYINAGRAYMTKKDIPRALEEFSKALALAPYHEDLHQTVEKLKKSLTKVRDSDFDDHPLN